MSQRPSAISPARAAVVSKVPGSGSSPVSPTTLELSQLRAHARRELTKVLGAPPAAGRIYFQDGAASTDRFPAVDLGRVVYVAETPKGLLPPGLKLAYVASLQGTSAIAPVRLQAEPPAIRYFNPTVTAVLNASVSDREVLLLRRELKAAFPSATVTSFGALSMLSVEASPSDLPGVCKFLQSRPGLESLDVSAEAYASPYTFGKAIDLGSGERAQRLDVASLATITRQLRERGVPFTTHASLPAPFGPGPRLGSG